MPSKRNENEIGAMRAGADELTDADAKKTDGDNFLIRLTKDFPQFRFIRGDKFKFRPPRTIIIGPDSEWTEMMLLHEVGHAVLGHKSYTTDLSRLKMEAAAWEKAEELAVEYGIEFQEEVAQRELDTYREWLHQKSRCPECGLTRFQSPGGRYHCPRCENFGSLS